MKIVEGCEVLLFTWQVISYVKKHWNCTIGECVDEAVLNRDHDKLIERESYECGYKRGVRDGARRAIAKERAHGSERKY